MRHGDVPTGDWLEFGRSCICYCQFPQWDDNLANSIGDRWVGGVRVLSSWRTGAPPATINKRIGGRFCGGFYSWKQYFSVVVSIYFNVESYENEERCCFFP